ncbi:MAG: hypothetical protein RJA22_3276, partial [Verrucomicrobiota bacterium]
MHNPALLRPFRSVLTLLLTAAILSLAGNLSAQVRFSWVRNGYSAGYANHGCAVATGPDGSVHAGGFMHYYMNLGSTNFYAYESSSSYDSLLTRYNGAGELLWSRTDGGHSNEEIRGTATDSSGNIYSCGYFGGTAYFSPSTNITSQGATDMFLAKYAPSGELLWVVRAGGAAQEIALSVAVDRQGQPVVMGYFQGSMSFGQTNLTSLGGQQLFAAKYSPLGSLLWAAHLGSGGDLYPGGVATGPNGETYINGWFTSNILLEDRCLFANAGADGFLARLSPSGSGDWIRATGGAGTEISQSVAVSPDGSIWTCGHFSGSLPSPGTNLNSMGNYDIYVARHSPQGTLLLSRSFGGTAEDYGQSLAIDAETNVYVTGFFASSPAIFGSTNLYTTGSYDLYLMRLDQLGDVRWATRAGNGNAEFAYGVAVSGNRDIYVTGYLSYNSSFGDTNVSVGSGQGFYLAKFTRDLPFIAAQPVSQVLSEGSTLNLSVTVTGTPPFALQWQFNGADLPGATNASLVVPGATTNLSGSYTVRISNPEGAVLSDPASVWVTSFSSTLGTTGLVWSTGGDAVWFSQTNVTYDGTEAARSGAITNSQQTWLQTQVTGPARLSFLWKISSENGYDFLRFSLDGTELTNTSGKVEWKLISFLIPAGTHTLRWAYTKDESESVGSDGGWLDNVSVLYTPAIPVPPPSLVVTSGIQVLLGATVTGTAPLEYQWQWFGTNLPGATSATLLLSNVQPAQAGPYTLVVSNGAGTATSAPGLLTVLTPPVISV